MRTHDSARPRSSGGTLAIVATLALGLSACTITTIGPTFPGAPYCGTAEACDEGCAKGDAHACGYMSQAALTGLGVPRSARKFVAYAVRGCELGDGRSCAQLALAYFVGVGAPKDWGKAAEYNERGCQLGFPVACSSLGYAYRDGHGVAADRARADALFAQACDGGGALGCLALAEGAPDGMVPADRAPHALPLLVHNCDPAINPAVRVCTVAARMYESGRGTEANLARARTLYETACKRGDPDACDRRERP